jgi:hypothetical protein
MQSIFVFGSNLAGRHGKGAALFARLHHGAIRGQGEGLQGSSYAIPTKDGNLNVLSLPAIAQAVERFRTVVHTHPEMTFQLTPVGCGLAGYKHSEIAPMFIGFPPNCQLPVEFQVVIDQLPARSPKAEPDLPSVEVGLHLHEIESPSSMRKRFLQK